jgi:uncharacterized membrane protein YhaH (DUF805 family)
MDSADKSPIGWALEPIRRYADFSGRSRRTEYWWFFLFQILVHAIFVVGVVAAAEAVDSGQSLSSIPVVGLGLVWIVFILGLIVPNAAVIVRRCHDNGIPGWVGGMCYGGMVLFSFIGVAILVMMMIEGKSGANEFGLDPKGRNTDDIFS